MKKLNILFIIVLFSFSASAQIQWQKCLGGTDGDGAYSIVQTSDSGYIVAGYAYSNDGNVTGNHGQFDYWVVKLNSSGNLQWQKSLGGSNNDEAYSIVQTSDNGFVIAGYSQSNSGNVTGNHGSSDYWVVKLNSSGTLQWQKCLGGNSADDAKSIIQTSDSGYIVAGRTSSNSGDVTGNHGGDDYWVVKLNSSGVIQWQKSLGGTGDDYAYSIIQTFDSGYVVAGYSNSNDGDVTGNNGYTDYWVVKLNASGNIQWQQSLGGTGSDAAYSIIQTSDSGYVVAGQSQSNDSDVTGNHGGFDYWVVKLNALGTIQWQQSLGGTSQDFAYSIVQTLNSGYAVTGASNSNNGDVTGNHGDFDLWVVKLNASGIIQWQKSLGGTGDDRSYSIIQTYNSEYVVAGYTQSYNGNVSGNHGIQDYWVVKLGVATGVEDLFKSNAINVYPNPSTDNFSISANSEFDNAQLNIFNDMGGNVYSCQLNRETKVIDAENFSSGIYYLQITKGEKMWGEKIVRQ